MATGKRDDVCEVHGSPSRAAHKALLLTIFACLILIVWHVWIYGPTVRTLAPVSRKSFPVLLASEVWDLFFDRKGVMAELRDILPYFIAGILLAGYLRTYKIAVKMRASLRRHGFLSIFIASLAGIITPLCACGTLTTAMSLLFAGVPLAPVMSILVTSPLLSPSAYLLTLNDLGPEWTVVRTAAAFSMGIFAGVVTHLLHDRGFRTREILIEGAIPRGDFHDEAYPDARLRCNCKETFGNRVAAKTENMLIVFLAKSSEMLWLVGKYVLVGVTIGAVAERYMPNEWICRLFGRKDPLNIVWITLGSVPVFVHQISVSSMLYHIKSSLDGTLNGGAALAFMIGGPVTAIPTMVFFWSAFRKRVFVLYLFICLAGTLIVSYAFETFLFVPYADTGNPLLKGVGSISGGPSRVIRKSDKNVRIVMDPGEKGIIATYRNDLGGQGAIVFDSSLGRFEDRYDNLTYVRNIAAWLEQNNSSPAKNSILAVLLDEKSTRDSLSSLAFLAHQGFKVTIAERSRLPDLSAAPLKDYGQLWFFFGSVPGKSLSESELETVSGFLEDGKCMMIASQAYADGFPAANQLSSRYGVRFTDLVVNQDELNAAKASYFLNRASEVLGKILKIVHKA